MFRALTVFALTSPSVLATACYERKPEEKGDLIAAQTIGPMGGTLAGAGITLDVPPGAVTADTEFELRTANRSLSVRDYEQSGGAYALWPEAFKLRLPAELSFAEAPDPAAVLFVQDELTVAAHGSSAWINELGAFAIAREGTPAVTMLEPPLGATPDEAGAPLRDLAHLRVGVSDTPHLNLALSLYDVAQHYTKPLNGNGDGDCGLQVEGQTVIGGSLSLACSNDPPLTGQVGVTSAEIQFDVVPNQSGKLEMPVVVGVVAGSDELAYQLGFFSFDTSPCYGETCSDQGTCEVSGDTPQCVCNPGHAPGDGLTCDCVPQCDGRECGGNGCGEFCPPGCPDGETCNDQGQCVPDGTDEGPMDTTTDGGDSTTDGGDTTTSGGGTTDGGTSSSTGM